MQHDPSSSAATEPTPPPSTEQRLRAIWSEVLGIRNIRANDNFVELGGDSIAITLCLNAIIREFGCEIPPAKLFEETMTLAGLAAHIDTVSLRSRVDS